MSPHPHPQPGPEKNGIPQAGFITGTQCHLNNNCILKPELINVPGIVATGYLPDLFDEY